MSHLRFGKNPINLPYLVTEPQFVACHRQSYVHEYDLIRGIKKGGTFLLNCTWSPEELDEHLPAKLRRQIAEKELNFYIINAAKNRFRNRFGRSYQHGNSSCVLQID